MVGLISRALVTSVTGAAAGAAFLVLAFTLDPDLVLEMDRDVPRVTSGFYPAEINRDDSFAWTGRSAVIRMPGADRRVPWNCAVRFRGGRSAPLEQPVVDLAADGITLDSRTAGNEYQTLEGTAPAQRSRTGLVLTITSSTTFIPGPADKRELGIQIDQVACRRAAPGLAVPPRRALAAATLAGAVFGAAFTLVGLSLPLALAATVLLALAQSVPLAAGPAPYSPYQDRIAPLAIRIALAAVLGAIVFERWRRQPLSGAARFVIGFSAAALFVQLLALLHPSKLVIDALFHAHRFQWVQGGRYYFTQPMPDGVQFPYAIALYVFALPWSVFTQDHVSLLRIIVMASHVLAGALLYAVVAAAWNDRLAGAFAVVLFQLVPLPYLVIGNANLTYAFGQSAAFATIAAAAIWTLRGRQVGQLAALFLLAALAFLSHVGVFPVLLTTLVAVAALYALFGGMPLRAAARTVFIAAIAAALFSVAAYYGRFGEVYKSLDRVRGRTAAAASPSAGTLAGEPASPRRTIPLQTRASTAVTLTVRSFGWPIVLLALAGAWHVGRARTLDRLTLVLAGGALTYVVFVSFGAFVPVEPRFQKYSDEFIDRVNYATIPVAVILAARGASWAWRAGLAPRVAAAILFGAAAVLGVQRWMAWLG